MDLSGLNRQLIAVNPQYSARFVPAPDESVDDEIEILLAGAKTRWGIQIGDGDFVVNEYRFDANGELEWAKSHAMGQDARTVASGPGHRRHHERYVAGGGGEVFQGRDHRWKRFDGCVRWPWERMSSVRRKGSPPPRADLPVERGEGL
jgi:hypothetical protein